MASFLVIVSDAASIKNFASASANTRIRFYASAIASIRIRASIRLAFASIFL